MVNRVKPPAIARPVWPVAVAVVLPPIALAAAIMVVGLPSAREDQPATMWVGGDGPGYASDAPESAIAAAHAAFHDIGDQCRSNNPSTAAIATGVDVITDFALRYPTGRFLIDDESSTPNSLLLFTREVVIECAPDEAASVDEAVAAIERARRDAP